MKIIEYLLAIKPSKDEQKRISSLLSENTELFNQLKNHKIDNNNVLSKELSKIKLDGFRSGHSQQKIKALSLILSNIKKGSNKIGEWNIYKLVCLESIFFGVPNLNELIFERNTHDDAVDKDILKLIISQSVMFDISEDTVKQLYELFPFQRQDDFENMLAQDFDGEANVKKEIGILRKEIKKINDKLNADKNINLEQQINDLVGQAFDQFSKKIEKKYIKEEKDSLAIEKINKLDEKLSKKYDELYKINSDTKNKVKDTVTIKGTIKHISTEVNSTRSELQHIDNRLSTIENEKPHQEEIQNPEEKINQVVDTLKEEFEDSISEKIELYRQALESSGDMTTNHVASKFEFYLDNVLSKPKDNISSENDFIALFHQELIKKHETVTPEATLTLHLFFKASQTFIIDDIQYYYTWLKALGWYQNHMNIVCSPVWSSQNDWARGVKHILNLSSNFPTSLCIYDFDIGLVECYLYPLLKYIQVSGLSSRRFRLALIASNDSDYSYDKKFFEYGSAIKTKHILENTTALNIKDELSNKYDKTFLKFKKNIEAGVIEKTFSAWQASIKQEELIPELHRTQQNLINNNIYIPNIIIINYLHLKNTFSEYLDHETSERLSLEHALLPWMQGNQNMDIELIKALVGLK